MFYTIVMLVVLCLSLVLFLQPLALILVFARGCLLWSLGFLLVLVFLLLFLWLLSLLFVCKVIKAFFIQLQFAVIFGEKRKDLITTEH